MHFSIFFLKDFHCMELYYIINYSTIGKRKSNKFQKNIKLGFESYKHIHIVFFITYSFNSFKNTVCC